jgi:hypothetical protein
VTDATHTITLTVDPGTRHNGVPGAGVVVDGQGAPNEIRILDSNVTAEWLEIGRVRRANAIAALTVRGVIGDPVTNVLLQNVLIHDFADATFNVAGIRLSGDDVGNSMTVRNCMIWNGDGYGIEGDEPSHTATIENCSIDGMAQRGIEAIASSFTIRNTIVTGSPTRDYDASLGGTVNGSNNIDSDGSAPATGRITSSAAALFVTPNANLHLKTGANSLDAVAGKGVRVASVREEDLVRFSTLRPSPDASLELVSDRRGVVRLRRRPSRQSRGLSEAGLFPEQWARVVTVGFQGEVTSTSPTSTPWPRRSCRREIGEPSPRFLPAG